MQGVQCSIWIFRLANFFRNPDVRSFSLNRPGSDAANLLVDRCFDSKKVPGYVPVVSCVAVDVQHNRYTPRETLRLLQWNAQKMLTRFVLPVTECNVPQRY